MKTKDTWPTWCQMRAERMERQNACGWNAAHKVADAARQIVAVPNAQKTTKAA